MAKRIVKTGNGEKVDTFMVDDCKRIKAVLWANEGDRGTMFSVQVQKGYKPAGSSKWNNQNMTYISKFELMCGIASMQAALEAWPEDVKQNAGTANEYTSVQLG
jgi:hypothetical protein